LREEDSLAEPVAVLAVKERELPAAAVGFVAEAIGTVSGSGAEVARPELLVDEVARDAPEGVAPAAKERAKRRVAAGRRVEASAAATEARATLRHNAAEDLKEKASGTAEEEEEAAENAPRVQIRRVTKVAKEKAAVEVPGVEETAGVEETPSTEAAQTATPDAEEKLWPELDGLLKDEDALSTPNAPYRAAVAEYRVVVYEPGTQVFVEDYAVKKNGQAVYDALHPCKSEVVFVKEFGKVESPEVAPEELQAKLGKENVSTGLAEKAGEVAGAVDLEAPAALVDQATPVGEEKPVKASKALAASKPVVKVASKAAVVDSSALEGEFRVGATEQGRAAGAEEQSSTVA
jgi:hypothetical protein